MSNFNKDRIINIKASELYNEFNSRADDYEYISLVYTSWHLDNLNVFINEHKLSKGIIIICPQSNINNESRYRLNISNFSDLDYSNCKIYRINNLNITFTIQNIIKRLFVIGKKSRPLYLINAAGINLKFLSNIPLKYKNIVSVILDEGTGSYISPIKDKVHKRVIGNKNNHKIYYHYLKDFIHEILKNSILFLLNISIINNLMFRNDGEKLIANETVCGGLFKYYKKNKDSKIQRKSIVLFTDFGVLNDEILPDFYTNLFEHLTSLNIHIYIKKHPNDRNSNTFNEIISKYDNIEILNYKKSGEQLIADFNPEFVVGGFSTVIFTSAPIFKLKSYSYLPIYKELFKLPKPKMEALEFFYKKLHNTDDNLVFINHFSEIEI